jgi:hypothetical protein
MGKRSDFPRRPMDDYATPYAAVVPLLPYLDGVRTFAEPCCGDGDLYRHLTACGIDCVLAFDLVRHGVDALVLNAQQFRNADAIITNPPWTRELLHPLISHFMRIKPTWLLFDADWMHTRQAAAFLGHCSHIVSVGRVKWIQDSPFTGKDNAAWYRFERHHSTGPRFCGWAPNPAVVAAE